MGREEVINNFMDEYFTLVNFEVKEIFKQYYINNSTFEEIGIYYGISKQAVEDKLKRNIGNIRKLLDGNVYKGKEVSSDVIIMKYDMMKKFDGEKNIYIKDEFMKMLNINNIDDNMIFFCEIIKVYFFTLEGKNVITNIVKKDVEKIYKTIIGILNEEVLGIDEFSLITKVKKKIKNKKLSNKLITTICKIVGTIEINDGIYRLTINHLSSYDKKAIRILSENGSPMYGVQIASTILAGSNEAITEEKRRAITNAMIKNEFLEPIGKTGIWVLKEWAYESGTQIDLIKQVFQKEDKPLTANMIYSQLCKIRSDITIDKIFSYLQCKDQFLRIKDKTYILKSWKKRYIKQLNEFNKINDANNNFEEILMEILNTDTGMNIEDITKRLHKKHISLSVDRIRIKINSISFVEKYKEGKKFYYKLSKQENKIYEVFITKILNILNEVKNTVENRKFDRMLKDKDENKCETDIQIGLYELMRPNFEKYDIDISRETETGSGPVDFKFSQGFKMRAFMELKLASNQNLYNGLEAQLLQYMGSEEIRYGIFIVIVFNDKEIKLLDLIPNKLHEIEDKYNVKIKFLYLDARGKTKSASKLKKGEEKMPTTLIRVP